MAVLARCAAVAVLLGVVVLGAGTAGAQTSTAPGSTADASTTSSPVDTTAGTGVEPTVAPAADPSLVDPDADTSSGDADTEVPAVLVWGLALSVLASVVGLVLFVRAQRRAAGAADD